MYVCMCVYIYIYIYIYICLMLVRFIISNTDLSNTKHRFFSSHPLHGRSAHQDSAELDPE